MPFNPSLERILPKSDSRSVLLVEDDDIHFELVNHAAHASPHLNVQIERAVSLGEAFSVIESSPPDIIVLDLGLPESEGLQTLETFLKRGIPIPVIVLTAMANLELGERAIQMGAMDFLGKDEISDRSLARSIRYSIERWKQKTTLDATIADLERFGNAAAHDLVSPLNAIQGFTRLIEIGLENTEVSKDIHECLHLLEVSSQRAADLVTDLHKFAKLGRHSISREETDLSELIEEVESSLQPMIGEHEGSLVVGSLPKLNLDRGLFVHVFQNLISNGLKYHRKGTPPIVAIDSCTVDGRHVINVRDNGIGISPSDRQRIFAPFERVKIDKAVDGTGIGLSICKRIIEAHDGVIWVESEVGRGSAFNFYINE
ncbi:hybrid sensor histidine kinase/response regulator [Pelagicoccus sp. SDUM812003]|uniref:sensor histidine kinase n=1 Tax=Pelagicoccus sp. SDUM812003 TaxID=3041267 RepID=UPI00280D35F5|nr:hybrid sensor histidine kinase/response regulator [Pelagicoccus sp. SDUM812003]MDQ8203066.1 hybrid sensor histidine kinase/response regulator [Pelagicoccus sp. SDUM812003]